MTKTMSKTRRVPARALQFAAELEIEAETKTGDELAEGDTTDSEEPKTELAAPTPLTLLARTAGIAEHMYWGRCVHDFAGMSLVKPRIPIDYQHDPREVLGFAESPNVADGNLRLSANLVSLRPDDMAATVQGKAAAGVPYECSIKMGDFSVEEVPEGMTVEANGQTFAGPLVVIRKWTLRGVAITPYGTDSGSAAEFADQGDEFAVEVIEPAALKPSPPPAGSTSSPALTVTSAAELARQFRDEFGDRGLEYLANGCDVAEARKQFAAHLVAENKSLRTQLDQANALNQTLRGTDPVSFSTAPEADPQRGLAGAAATPPKDEFAHLPEHMARYCRAMKYGDKKVSAN